MNSYLRLKFNKRAQALMAVCIIIIFVFLAISAAVTTKAITERNLYVRDKLFNEVFYLAEGGIEHAISVFTSAIANYQIAPDVENFNVSTNFTTFDGATVNSTINRIEDIDRLVLEGQTMILVRNYEIASTAVHPQNNQVTVTLHQIIARRLIPTFQHAVFYAEDLEILPGPNMTLSGRTHSNQDIYIDSNNILTVDSLYLRSAGNIYNRRKDDGSRRPGEVSIRVNKPGAPQYEDMDNLDSESPNWTTEAINRWQGTVQSAVHGVTKLTAPSVASIQPDGFYASNAEVFVRNGVITKNGVVLIEGVDYPVDTITTSTTFYNNREEKDIKMTEIDLEKLAGYAPGDPSGSPSFPNNLPTNGLLYATRDDAGVYQPGIRLKQANEIHSNTGLTVVSNDPVYIQGNFNTVDKKAASVICDALNLLSRNWEDANSRWGLNSRIALETTVNCTFIAGIDTTSAGNYNGGLENYPRLHEKWSRVNLNIKGSFVALWNSIIATGAWVYGDPQYTAPIRNWEYDIDLNNTNNLPPFTPWAVEARRIAWWVE